MVIPLVALTAPVMALIPHAAIAGLLVLVGWTLLERPRWRHLARASRQELAIAAVTCTATLTLRLEPAVLIGSALSLGLYLHRTSRPAMRTMGIESGREDLRRPFVVVAQRPQAKPECPQLKLLRMEGSVYFGGTAHVSDQLQALREEPRPQQHLLVMAKSMNSIDLAGSDLWRQELHARRAAGGDLYFHRLRPRVVAQWQRDGFLQELDADHVFHDKRSAIHAICGRLDPSICARCTVRVFKECLGPGET